MQPSKFATAAIILISSLCSAREIPNAPTPQPAPTPLKFWAATGAYTAAIFADDLTTQGGLHRGCHEAENPALYGRHPSQARFLAVSFGIEAGEVIAARRMVRARSRVWNAIGYSILGAETAGRAGAAFKNANAECK